MNSFDEQEKFWCEDFGNEYTERNNTSLITNNVKLFEKILKNMNTNMYEDMNNKYENQIKTVFEIGCNRGLNLIALKQINNDLVLNGIEINTKAYNILKELNICNKLYNKSIFDFNPDTDMNIENKEDSKYDLVFSKGVLIHINQDKLSLIYDKMYQISKKYILIAEYYSRQPQEIVYRGYTNKLYKRDFCGEIMDKYSDLKLIDYGFVYHRDSNFPLDDITWFLLEKS
jgi:spore coat polysaccharide biosynthesis protein SpsF